MLEIQNEKEVVQIGNSLAVILPREVTRAHDLSKGDKLLIQSKGQEITLTPKRFKPIDLYGIVKGGPRATYKDFRNVRKLLERGFEKRMKKLYK